MSRKYLVYISKPTGFRVYNSLTKGITDIARLPSTNICSRFYVPKHYTADDKGIFAYVDDFEKWVEELKDNEVLKIIYDKYYSHNSAVEMTFKRLAKGTYENHDKIDSIECSWMEKCYNTGLMYCKTGKYESHGYDFSLFYPSILASNSYMIPTRRGKEVILKKLAPWEKLQVGYYKVKITCQEENFQKIFSFSKHNIYTHLSLQQALKHQAKFNVNIELVQDGKPNSYLYEKRHCVSGATIFGKWYETIIKLRELLPKNGLVKQLGSSLWGHLVKSNIRNVTYKQIEEEKLDIGLDSSSRYILEDHVTKTTSEYYIIRDSENPYIYNIRIKAFLPSAGRNKISEVVLEDIDNCIRAHTDNAVFCKKQSFTKFDKLIPEQKTSGLIEWTNVSTYTHLEASN